MTDPVEALSESTRLSILQGRFEALHQGAAQVEPRHILLGLLKTMEPHLLTSVGLDPAACAALIEQLGSTPAPAPLSPNDIDYADACHAGIVKAAAGAGGDLVEPVDLLRVLRGDDEMTR